MNKYRNTDKDIHTRIYKFIVGCLRDIVKKIPKTTENIPIISQLSSSLTSIGANDQEADASSTPRDFIAKYTIVRKESKETKYWLTLVKDSVLIQESNISYYIDECQEILNIVSKIIENTRRR